MFGTFTVPDNGTVAQLATFKSYNFDDQEYSYDFPSTYDSLSLSYVAGAYILHMPVPVANGEAVVDVGLTMTASTESPMRSTVPADPNGDSFDARYQVTQERWNDIFTNKALLDNGNFTVNYSSTAQLSVPGVFKVSGNKYSDAWSNGEVYYEKTGNTLDSLGCYTYSYIYSSNGSWTSLPASYGYVFFDQWLGTFPAPFLNRANYASSFHYYYINEFRFTPEGESQQRVITNFRVWFSNGNPTKIEFQESGASYTFLFTDYGETTVTLPTQGGNGSGGNSSTPTNATEVYELLENKVLAYNMVTNNSGRLDQDELNVAREASEGAILSIFENNAFELYFNKLFNYDTALNIEATFYGTYSLTSSGTDARGDYFAGTAVIATSVVGDDVDTTGFSQNVRWYTSLNLFRINMGDYFIYFEVTQGTPTHTPIPQAGGEGGNGNENGQGGNEGGEGGGNGGNSQTTIYTDFGNEYVLRETVMTLGSGSGIKVVMERGDEDYSTTMTFAAKGGIFCIIFEDGDTQYCDMRDLNNITYYSFDYVEDQWFAESVSLDEAKRNLEFDMFFTYNSIEYDAADRTATTLTVDGKSIDVYQYDFEYGEVMKLDQTTGICLYYVDDDWFEIMRVFLLEGVEDVSLPIL